jgi:hypothetical protein
MPVLSQHNVRKGLGDAIYDWDYLLAIPYRKAPARKETVLDIDHDEHASLI